MVYTLKNASGEVIATSTDPITVVDGLFRARSEVWYDPLPGGGATVEETPDPPAVPEEVTMRQARLALLAAGKLNDVQAAIDAIADASAKAAAQITWDYSSVVQRHNGLVAAMAPGLGLSESQLDDLFLLASAL